MLVAIIEGCTALSLILVCGIITSVARWAMTAPLPWDYVGAAYFGCVCGAFLDAPTGAALRRLWIWPASRPPLHGGVCAPLPWGMCSWKPSAVVLLDQLAAGKALFSDELTS